jgi:hypothetical protein
MGGKEEGLFEQQEHGAEIQKNIWQTSIALGQTDRTCTERLIEAIQTDNGEIQAGVEDKHMDDVQWCRR